ncbi:hypothetical protein OG203_39925 [Nocardia sp. NBC_01499]|uniref:hypothetical protein n=1 Tax=Nocardia sp. NBC_01499 TaxID=2903597 RepID=UPI00386F9CCD
MPKSMRHNPLQSHRGSRCSSLAHGCEARETSNGLSPTCQSKPSSRNSIYLADLAAATILKKNPEQEN